MTHELPAQGKAFAAFAWKPTFALRHRRCPGARAATTGRIPGPPQHWETLAWLRHDAFNGLGMQIPPGLLSVVGEEVEDPSMSQTGQPGPGDTLRAATLGEVPKLLGGEEGALWGGTFLLDPKSGFRKSLLSRAGKGSE